MRLPTPGLWVGIWLLTGIVAVICCAAVVLSGRAVLTFVRRASRILLISAAVGAVALLAGSFTDSAWRPLGGLTLRMVAALISCVATDGVMDPAHMVVGTRRFSIEISPGCSGYESIGLIWVFLGVYLWAFRRSLRLPRALLLLPLGAVLMGLLNVFRIASLIAVGTWVSPDIAIGGFHSYAGWLLFCGVALGMVATTRRSSFFTAVPLVSSEGIGPNPTAAYLGPLLALLTVSMLGSAFSRGSGGFEILYPLRVLAVAATLWIFRRQYQGLGWTWSWAAVGAGVAVFILWMGLEGTPAAAGDHALQEGVGAATIRLAGCLAGVSRSGNRGHRAACRGAGVPRVCPAPADRCGFRERELSAIHRIVVLWIVAVVRRLAQPSTRGLPRRRCLRPRALPARRNE